MKYDLGLGIREYKFYFLLNFLSFFFLHKKNNIADELENIPVFSGVCSRDKITCCHRM